MPKERIVLVTGVSDYWGSRLTSWLVNQPSLHILGLDTKPPERAIKGLDFIQADMRNPLVVDLLKSERVDTVCHLSFVETAEPSETAFDINVMGTQRILGACLKAGVRKVVLKSSTAVYGAKPGNSLYLEESQPVNADRSSGSLRDLAEIESLCKSVVEHHPEMGLTVLRFAHIVGPTAVTPMTCFLGDTRAPALLGFDPLMQVVHEEDVVNALGHGVLNDKPGAFNIAAEGVFPLWRLMGLAGKIGLPVLHPLAYLSTALGGPRYAPMDLDYLRYPCIGDLRKMHEQFEFTPRFTGEDALKEFATQQRMKNYVLDENGLKEDQTRLRETIETRRRARLAEGKAKHNGRGVSHG